MHPESGLSNQIAGKPIIIISQRWTILLLFLLSNGGSFLGVLSKAFCALQSHLKFLQLFSGGGGSLYLLFGATG